MLDNGLAGTGRAVRPVVTVLVDYPTLAALVAAADTRPRQGSLLDDAGGGDGSSNEGPSRTPPMVTAAMLTGQTVAGGPQYEDRTPVPRKVLDRIACDSRLNRILFGPDSEVLDVGRTERTFTRARRAAIIARDKHCRYPTCTAPPIICQAHHVEQWARDGGKTSVDNGILLCAFHHRIIHDRNIAIRRHRGRWEFTDRHGEVIDPERDRPLGFRRRRAPRNE
ncbi:HNH endonuclease signature motif containing protein [Cellulomonas sp. ATA003]|uniref:HNH endonuclease signature motif containing protein n=1 Tax=Cellulomonas sp. ATA003 TaxID=3073064 RepID=UPI002872E5D0|nr:HNH endonuclease signature motif containing protein [Cellulomonas sp. ATA003]WNB86212.1 HNH endonuclease signature motif containing protein [Cellulomonas sp. ATA003]